MGKKNSYRPLCKGDCVLELSMDGGIFPNVVGISIRHDNSVSVFS